MTEKQELKPCPACESPANIVGGVAQCALPECDMVGPSRDPDGAKWNALPRHGSDGARLRKALSIAKRCEEWHQGRDDERSRSMREAYAGMANEILRLLQEPKPEPSEPVPHPADLSNVCAIRRKSDGYWWECSSEHGAGWNDKRIRQAWTMRAAEREVAKHLQREDVEIVELGPRVATPDPSEPAETYEPRPCAVGERDTWLARILPTSHWVDVVVRLDGKTYRIGADFLKEWAKREPARVAVPDVVRRWADWWLANPPAWESDVNSWATASARWILSLPTASPEPESSELTRWYEADGSSTQITVAEAIEERRAAARELADLRAEVERLRESSKMVPVWVDKLRADLAQMTKERDAYCDDYQKEAARAVAAEEARDRAVRLREIADDAAEQADDVNEQLEATVRTLARMLGEAGNG